MCVVTRKLHLRPVSPAADRAGGESPGPGPGAHSAVTRTDWSLSLHLVSSKEGRATSDCRVPVKSLAPEPDVWSPVGWRRVLTQGRVGPQGKNNCLTLRGDAPDTWSCPPSGHWPIRCEEGWLAEGFFVSPVFSAEQQGNPDYYTRSSFQCAGLPPLPGPHTPTRRPPGHRSGSPLRGLLQTGGPAHGQVGQARRSRGTRSVVTKGCALLPPNPASW